MNRRTINMHKELTSSKGERLARFLNGITVVDTKIGETNNIGGVRYMYCGKSIDSGSGGDILMKCESVSIAMSKALKFADRAELVEYLKTREASKEIIEEYLARFDGILRHKKIIQPFNIGEEVSGVVEDGGKTFHVSGKIEFMEFKLDAALGEYTGRVILNSMYKPKTKVKFDIEDYDKKFFISRFKSTRTLQSEGRDCLQMMGNGIIRPIMFKSQSNGNEVMIDCNEVYVKTGYRMEAIGRIEDMAKMKVSEFEKQFTGVTDKKLIKIVQSNIRYIEMHRKIIAPHWIYEPYVVEV